MDCVIVVFVNVVFGCVFFDQMWFVCFVEGYLDILKFEFWFIIVVFMGDLVFEFLFWNVEEVCVYRIIVIQNFGFVVQDVNDMFGDIVWYIRNVVEIVDEWIDKIGVVVGEFFCEYIEVNIV